MAICPKAFILWVTTKWCTDLFDFAVGIDIEEESVNEFLAIGSNSLHVNLRVFHGAVTTHIVQVFAFGNRGLTINIVFVNNVEQFAIADSGEVSLGGCCDTDTELAGELGDVEADLPLGITILQGFYMLLCSSSSVILFSISLPCCLFSSTNRF